MLSGVILPMDILHVFLLCLVFIIRFFPMQVLSVFPVYNK